MTCLTTQTSLVTWVARQMRMAALRSSLSRNLSTGNPFQRYIRRRSWFSSMELNVTTSPELSRSSGLRCQFWPAYQSLHSCQYPATRFGGYDFYGHLLNEKQMYLMPCGPRVHCCRTCWRFASINCYTARLRFVLVSQFRSPHSLTRSSHNVAGLLITTVLTQVLISGGITVMLVSTYLLLRLGILVRNEGTDGVAKWASGIQNYFTSGSAKTSTETEESFPLNTDTSISSVKTEDSVVLVEGHEKESTPDELGQK